MRTRSRTVWIIAGAASAALVLLAHQGSTAAIFQAALAFMLCCIAAYDVETRRIENRAVLAIACLRIYEAVLAGVSGPARLGSALAASLASGAAALAILLATAWLSKRLTGSEGIGGGDVKLLAALAFFLGWEKGLAIAGLSCTLLVAGQALPRRKARSLLHAFAPYIAVSSSLALLVM